MYKTLIAYTSIINIQYRAFMIKEFDIRKSGKSFSVMIHNVKESTTSMKTHSSMSIVDGSIMRTNGQLT